MTSKFIHCDCDCFFAAIEIRDDPSLKGRPVAVGGSVQQRGVIATCSYEARQYGVHSAMSTAAAQRLCPDLIILPGNMEKYRFASAQIMGILRQYSELIEPVSVDEAYLDVSEASACQGSATLIARQIRQQVREQVGITVSTGVAPNKFLAKVASDWNKPDGQFVITPEQVNDFIVKLPVKKLHGVGKVTARRMLDLGIENCRHLQRYSLLQLIELFGGFGTRLYSLCRGIDDRQISTQRQRKSISIEHTFSRDLDNLEQCLQTLPQLQEKLRLRIDESNKAAVIGKQFVKIRFNNFVSTTVEQQASDLDPEVFRTLCTTGFERGNKPVRLLGVGVRMKDVHGAGNFHQLEFSNF